MRSHEVFSGTMRRDAALMCAPRVAVLFLLRKVQLCHGVRGDITLHIFVTFVGLCSNLSCSPGGHLRWPLTEAVYIPVLDIV